MERAIARTPGVWHVVVLLKTTLEEARSQIPPALATLEAAEDGVLLRAYVNRLEWMAAVLAGLGCPLVIQQPAELREALAAHARNLAAWAEAGRKVSA